MKPEAKNPKPEGAVLQVADMPGTTIPPANSSDRNADSDKFHRMSELQNDGNETGSNDFIVLMTAVVSNFRLPVSFFMV